MKVMEIGQRARPKFYYVDPPLLCNSGENFPRHDSEGGAWRPEGSGYQQLATWSFTKFFNKKTASNKENLGLNPSMVPINSKGEIFYGLYAKAHSVLN